jgi:hypothetical protein
METWHPMQNTSLTKPQIDEQHMAPLRSLFPIVTITRLLIAWAVVVAFALWGKG